MTHARRAAPAACAIVSGYAIGTLTVLMVLASTHDTHGEQTTPWETFAGSMMFWRYRFEGFDQPYGDTPHHSIEASVLFVGAMVAGASLAAAAVSACWPPRAVRHAAEPDRARLRRLWAHAVRGGRRTPTRRDCLALFLAALVGVWLCFGVDALVMAIRRRLWMRNPMADPGFDPTPTPIIGWMTWPDAVWIAGLAAWSGWLVVRASRRRWNRSRFVGTRWCPCGYGFPARSPNPTCPECGPRSTSAE